MVTQRIGSRWWAARRILFTAALVMPLAACGHSDLRAPCGPVASAFGAVSILFPLRPPEVGASIDCGPLKPANG
jgi:hypothetical protein